MSSQHTPRSPARDAMLANQRNFLPALDTRLANRRTYMPTEDPAQADSHPALPAPDFLASNPRSFLRERES